MKNIDLIGISGKKRHGKDTVADLINEIVIDRMGFRYQKHAYGWKVKEVAAILTGIPANQWETTEQKMMVLGPEWDIIHPDGSREPITRRRFMTKLGSDVITTYLNKDAWINSVFGTYTPASKWILSDVRFYNEVASIRSRNGILIRVVNPAIQDPLDVHPSEVELDDYRDWDYVIVNDGTLDDLKKKVEAVLEDMGRFRYF